MDKEDLNQIKEVIREELRPTKVDITKLKDDVGSLKSDVTELKDDVSELKDDVGSLKVELFDVHNMVDAIWDKLTIHDDQFKSVEIKVTELDESK